MRPTAPTLLALVFLALVAPLVAGCGGDDAEETPPTTRPAPRQPAADTTLGDTVPLTDTTAAGAARGEGADAAGEAGAGGASGQEGGAQAARTQAPGQRPGDAARPGEPSAPATTAEGRRLYTVQVAAFTDATTAEEWTARLRRQGLPVWTSMAEPGGRTFYRVRVGAVPSVREARRLGALISERYEWPVWVAPMTAADRPPEGARESSQRLLQGG